jgi:hypothetical protein
MNLSPISEKGMVFCLIYHIRPSPVQGEGWGEGEDISMGYGHNQVIPCIKERRHERDSCKNSLIWGF